MINEGLGQEEVEWSKENRQRRKRGITVEGRRGKCRGEYCSRNKRNREGRIRSMEN